MARRAWDAVLDLAVHLLDPWLFMALALRHVPRTVRGILASDEPGRLLSPAAFSDALFGHFWAVAGPDVKAAGEERVVPLLQGRVEAGRVRDAVVGVPVHGIVLEVGAGSGMWADVLARIHAEGRDGQDAALPVDGRNGVRARAPAAGPGPITKIYGVEPNPQSAAALRQRVRDVGLGEVYEVVPVGIESVGDPAAWAGQIPPGSVDCIVGILCLCSIPDPDENIRRLYKLLKPGGRWYVYEHVEATRGGPLLSLYQRFVSIPWAFFIGSCRICRPTGKRLRDAGPWQAVDLTQPPDEPPYQVLPHILGTLTK